MSKSRIRRRSSSNSRSTTEVEITQPGSSSNNRSTEVESTRQGSTIDNSDTVYSTFYTPLELDEIARRKATFDHINWPSNVRVSKKCLAEAGFVYLGRDDVVKCVFCSGCLRNWKPDQDPVSEHFRFFGQNCKFVRNMIEKIKSSKFHESEGSWLRARLDLPWVRIALKHFPTDTIKQAFKWAYNCKKDFPNVDVLLEKIADIERARAKETGGFPRTRESILNTTGLELDDTQTENSSIVSDGRLSTGTDDHVLFSTFDRKGFETDLYYATPAESWKEMQDVCMKCLRNRPGHLLYPCRHFVLCDSCVQKTKTCPVCQMKFKHTIRLYLD